MSNRHAATAEKPNSASPLLNPLDWNQAKLDTPVKLYGEMMRFMAQRLQAQASFLQGLADCQNPTDLMSRQASFLQNAMEAYSSEAGRSWKILQEPATPQPPAA
ncbi:phasin family protein [Roseomonas frigidaquae]|uniref:Phasin family protein n=1 Tax=Falsiroseomonas frigidaquae TaxID=487318 RepID=A0ABX1F4D1_9PROT|nr:phasin family protein [Falsiroseomonas frigidaquae]NKE47129.1 phasin family protein [Falsiroseomonas frigidaquae]